MTQGISFDDLAAQARGHVRDMYQPPITLPDQMGETYLPRLQHLLYELEQPTIFTTDNSDNLTGFSEL